MKDTRRHAPPGPKLVHVKGLEGCLLFNEVCVLDVLSLLEEWRKTWVRQGDEIKKAICLCVTDSYCNCAPVSSFRRSKRPSWRRRRSESPWKKSRRHRLKRYLHTLLTPFLILKKAHSDSDIVIAVWSCSLARCIFFVNFIQSEVVERRENRSLQCLIMCVCVSTGEGARNQKEASQKDAVCVARQCRHILHKTSYSPPVQPCNCWFLVNNRAASLHSKRIWRVCVSPLV